MRRIVFDTNVLIAALRSRHGASNKLFTLVGRKMFTTVISVPLVLEYEEASHRQIDALPYSIDEVDEIIDFVCAHSEPQAVYYLWRPLLPDPEDDHVLEVAVAGRCDTIVTFNQRDFRGAELFGIQVLTPSSFLKEMQP
jgi:putative PIN family toxin of toxin-antitoxin system